MPDSPVSPVPAKPWGIWATLGLSSIVLVVFLLAQTLVAVGVLTWQFLQQPEISVEALTQNVAENGFVLAIATLVSNPICIALVVWFIRLRKRLSVNEYLGLKKPNSERLMKWSLITIIFIVAADLLKSLVDRPVIPSFMTDIYETAYFLPLLWLAIVVLAPIFEEVFFRGFLFKGLQASALGSTGAIVLPALLWALIHLQYPWYDMAGIFVFGLMLGYAQYRTGSLYVPIAMHALNNLLAVIQVAIQAL
jgi:uncharacterized protein